VFLQPSSTLRELCLNFPLSFEPFVSLPELLLLPDLQKSSFEPFVRIAWPFCFVSDVEVEKLVEVVKLVEVQKIVEKIVEGAIVFEF
jgi:hypothetical protein